MKKRPALLPATPSSPPAVLDLVRRRDAETAARVAYATGRRDAMLTLAEEMKPITGQMLLVDDIIEAVTSAAHEFNDAIEQVRKDEPPVETPEQKSARLARERLVLPS